MARAGAEEKLYKIGEVCKLADVQPYVLRYWETEFPQLAPNKSGGGQRLYTRREIDVILRIKDLLYRDGFTIAGAKKQLESALVEPEPAAAAPVALAASAGDLAPDVSAAPAVSNEAATRVLLDVKRELTSILQLLDE